VVERQSIDQRPEAKAFGALCDSRQIHAWRGSHAERREVMLGHVICIKSAAFECFDHAEAIFIELVEFDMSAIKVIENADVKHSLPARFFCRRHGSRLYLELTIVELII
jgi:hypothetical protein